ncbi:hypothetical protein JTE90_004099 [Oedothorax gibbosus]|uniref:Right handed beta helix domain-containing protein n=1 Tax=Oedothorax gibbosus TaxID=931172 RepID=A0AAV6V3Q3_9ARAC|nr:hypothetical protein JTE90_004099 [Oedothorax gibbosus]
MSYYDLGQELVKNSGAQDTGTMDTTMQLDITSVYPNIYKVELEAMSFQDLATTFTDELLQGCSFSNLEFALVDYITSIVEPVGWRAVWRSSKESSILDLEYDFIVEVVNVSLEKLEAEVFLKSIIAADRNFLNLETLRPKVKMDCSLNVPLTELYVISEDDEEDLYQKTAVAIEHVKFFLKHISRPWDGEDDITYSEEVLKSRLQLFFDMKNNILPKTMISKIKSLLKEGARVQKELHKWYRDHNVSDSEAEINEEDFMHSMSLKRKLEKLQAKMEMLENPVIRSFVTKKYSPNRPLKRPAKSKPVTYVVAKEFTSQMITELSIDPSSTLEFEHNPEAAFKYSSAGDKIFIFPGTYQCDTLGWVECEIFVKGIGLNTDIVLEATGNSDILLNCCSQKVEIQNISLKAKAGLLSAVVVHHGKIELRSCIINGNEAEIGLLLLGGAEAILEYCYICNPSDDGIQMRSLSSLNMKSSKINFAERHGIQIDAESGLSGQSSTDLTLSDCHITNNGGHGIFLNNAPITDISLQRPSGDFSTMELFPWIKHKIEDTVMDHNGESGIGVSSSCKNKSLSDSTINTNGVNHDNLNYSALSDLLNEVNLSVDYQDSVNEL